jgi:hypothetical protein
VDVVPYQVCIRGQRPPTRATVPQPPRPGRRKLPRVVRRRSRRLLTPLALAFGCLAFSVTAQAGIDDSATNAEPPAATPTVALSAPPAAAPDPVQTAMTDTAANEAEPLVSAQYQDEDGATSVPVEQDTAPAQADDLPAVDSLAGSSSSSQSPPPAPAANPLLVTHAESPPIQPTTPSKTTRPGQPSSSSSTAVAPQSPAAWYRPHNSQYQFDSSFRNTAQHSSTTISSENTAKHTLDQAAVATATERLTGQVAPSPSSIGKSLAHLNSAASISGRNLREVAKTWRRYHPAQPQYRAGASEREAVSNVMGTLGAAAQQVALRGTAVRPSPDRQPVTARVESPPVSSPAVALPPLLPRAAAAAKRGLSLLAPSRPPELLAVPPAARIARRLGASLLPKLEAIPGPRALRERNLAGGRLADTRRLLQIGLALGLAYLVFLTLWFWGTRGRRRGLRGGARF